jgi:transcription elongation factor Elf1
VFTDGDTLIGGESMPETRHTSLITCPFCGDKWDNSCEIDFGVGVEGTAKLYCDECEQEFFASKHCEITYCTSPLMDGG